jgi:hypothetical protein
MNGNNKSLENDESLLFGYMAEYMDESLPGKIEATYAKIAAAKINEKDYFEAFAKARGKLQTELQKYRFGDKQMRELHSLVVNDAARVAHENKDIESAGRSVVIQNVLRQILLAALVVALATAAYVYLKPQPRVEFSPLDTLVYEALAMEEDPAGRIDLPTAELSEVIDYVNTYPELGYRLPNFKDLSSEWRVEGGSVIDYDLAKIAMLVYKKEGSGENAFVFTYKGDLRDLPEAERGNIKGLVYQTYASQKVNVVAWQMPDGLVGMIVGHQAAPKLAEMAASLSGS